MTDKEQRHEAKQRLAVLMQQGASWKEAAASAGIHISRSTTYRWLAAWRMQVEWPETLIYSFSINPCCQTKTAICVQAAL